MMKIEVEILGKHIGNGNGWDQMEADCLVFYDVDTSGNYPELDGDFTFNSTTGLFEKYDDETGEVIWSSHAFEVFCKDKSK